MKMRLLAIALVSVMVGLGSCGGKKDKSKENEIVTFKVGTVDYQINHATGLITHLYKKTGENTWPGLPSGWPKTTAVVTLKDLKARISPDPNVTPINLENDSFTVTAEDGTPKTYTVKATRDLDVN